MALSPETKALICEHLADGQSLRAVLRMPGMPSRGIVFRELEQDEAFANQYARAKQVGIEALADDVMAIADETEVANVYDSEGNIVDVKLDATAVARNRLRVDSRKWILSKLAPKKYGDKLDHNIGGSVDMIHKIVRTVVRP